MKISREVRVGILAAICLFLLYFGFKFLKGTNIFNPIHSYTGRFTEMRGLVEQAPVYVRGYKVGQVETISYDYSQDTAFTIVVSINRDIRVVEGSRMYLVPDGLLGGMAVEVDIPAGSTLAEIPTHSELPTSIKPSLMDNLQSELLASVDSTLATIRSLAANLDEQLGEDKVRTILDNTAVVTERLSCSAGDLEKLMHSDLPVIVAQVDSILTDVKMLADNASQADIAALVSRADSAVAEINMLLQTANSQDGTVGMLMHDNTLYRNLNQTIQTADSLMQDIREQPNSIVWGKKKKKK